MAVIPQLIAEYALLLYGMCALGTLFYIWSAIRARQESDQALYSIQRDSAVSRGLRAWLMAGLFVLIAIGVFVIYAYVEPTLADEAAMNTPPASLLLTPTPTGGPPTLSAEPGASANTLTPTPGTPAVTPTPAPTLPPLATLPPVTPDTPTPEVPTEPQVLTSAGVQITYPAPGDRLWGIVEIRGTANIPEFNFYKFELQFPGSSDWATLEIYNVPVAGGVLGYWDTTNLPTGEYKLRLVVVDNTHNYPPPFEISIVIEPPSTEGE